MVKRRVKNEEISEMIEQKGLRATADYLVKVAGYTISSTYGKLRDLGVPSDKLQEAGIHKYYFGTMAENNHFRVMSERRVSNKRPIDKRTILALVIAKWSDEKIIEEFFGNEREDIVKAIKEVRVYYKKRKEEIKKNGGY